MKIAIFHDYFDEIGGAELTMMYLARALNATIFTTNIDREKVAKAGFSDVKFKSIGSVPKIKHLKQLCTEIKFFFLKVKGYDYHIFGSSFSIYAARNHYPNLWFCFSPLRGLYDLRYDKKGFFEALKQPFKSIHILFDKVAVHRMQSLVCNSQNTRKRIKKYYHLDAKVIHSPVDTSEFKNKKSENYWLSVSRIDPYKRIELVTKAFGKLSNEKLVVVGGAISDYKKYFEKIKKESTKNIEFKGAIYNRKELVELYSKCKGLIVVAKSEDFGKTPIEAMASGKPVIAANEGGYKETIIDSVTGKLIDDVNPDNLARTIRETSKKTDKYKEACLKQAKKFDVRIFVEKMKQELK
ncbi:glycosyltransferase [Candidatus Woesearchaeota archaeon]|nr:glycosyltransferase [Candidatus Woesearchaeota archaeon]